MESDRFSKLASEYAQYRPGYPPQLAKYLASLTHDHQLAWDCATGNGQMAEVLSTFYRRIVATDVSLQQINYARHKNGLIYTVAKSERSPLPDKSVDLVAVAQAIQWFDFERFYQQVGRVLKPQGVIAAWGYGQPEIDPKIDQLLWRYYHQILGPYLPSRLDLIEQRYRTLPFPFREITPPEFTIEVVWKLDHLLGTMASLSPVVTYQAERGKHPLDEISQELHDAWGTPEKRRRVRWRLFFRIGRHNR
jgi:SAM-dependent methyltransferase